jgi:DNA replication ATP-dependent helicase Dna2
MTIASYSNDLGKSLSKIHRHSYTFVRSNDCTSESRASLLSGHIAKGDPVNISIEPDLLCLSRGFVLDLTPTTITIGVTYLIDTDALLARTLHRGHQTHGDQVVFRIDKDEMTSGLSKMRANLAALFFENGAETLRRLVVDHAAPRFDLALRPTEKEKIAHFNEDQQRAMEAVLTTQDYSLILGMPGTGKTTTIAEIINTLVQRGKTVLLTSYTHSAVDTILTKLLDAPFEVLRLGNMDKVRCVRCNMIPAECQVHPDVQHLTLEATHSESIQALDAQLTGPPVVAATCLSVDQ